MTVLKARFWRITGLAGLLASLMGGGVWAGQSTNTTVVVGTIIHNPPYVMENPSSGIDVETIREAFQATGVKVEFVHAPLARLGLLLDHQRIDAMTAYRTRPDQCTQSDVFGTWHNGIVVRRGLQKTVTSFADLAGLQVGMFLQAKDLFGSALTDHEASFEGETIVHTTPSALRMLAYGRIDAYIGDSWGLDYLIKDQILRGEERPYKVAVAFEPTPRQLCFHNDELRESFNRGLKIIHAEGISAQIISKYLAVMPN